MANNFFSKVVDTIFPNNIKCFVCSSEIPEKESHCVCSECSSKLPFIKKPCKTCGEELTADESFCLRCQNRKRAFKKAFAMFNYEDEIVGLIHSFKYDNAKWLAKHFADFLFEALIENKTIKPDYVIPVPLCKRHKKKRGYNQSKLLCVELNKVFTRNKMPEIKILKDALIRVKETKDQIELTAKERVLNMEGAFAINENIHGVNQLKGKTILLIDDVFTTGATSEECCKTLKKAGAKEVYVLTVAHTKFKVL